MAIPVTAALKAFDQVANTLGNLGKSQEEKSNVTLKLAGGIAIGLIICIAAIVSILQSPVKFADALLDKFKDDYSYIMDGGNISGNVIGSTYDYKTLTENLDTSAARKAVVETGLSLMGRVPYFWGGKSNVIGWDDRWGDLKKVTAAGSPSTGTYRAYGMDCSGFVDWVFNNALGYVIGQGGGARSQYANCIPIQWADAQPGDLVFFADCVHVGIVVKNDNGKLTIVHCSSGHNNVVVMTQSAPNARCFLFVGRPNIYETRKESSI